MILKKFNVSIIILFSLLSLSCILNAEKFNEQGLEKQKLGNNKEAINLFTKAISIDPNYVEAYINRGSSYLDLESFHEAISDYNKAIVLNSNYAIANYKRGLAFKNLKDYDNAILDFTKAIEIKPNYEDAYYNRGNLYFILKDYPKSISDYNKVLLVNPNNTEAYKNRDIVKTKLQDKIITMADKPKQKPKWTPLDPRDYFTPEYNKIISDEIENNKNEMLSKISEGISSNSLVDLSQTPKQIAAMTPKGKKIYENLINNIKAISRIIQMQYYIIQKQ